MQEFKCDAVIAAAGKSQRMDGCDKLFLPLAEESVLERTVGVFLSHPGIERVIVVTREDIVDAVRQMFPDPRVIVCVGGSNRTESVKNGLRHCISRGVLIHDGARPFVSTLLITAVIESVIAVGSGIPALPVTDSVRQAKDGFVTKTPDRSQFFTVQTPQGFLTKDILSAYSRLKGEDYTDDAQVYARFIAPPKLIKGEERNIKITTLGSYLGINAKVGIGYDLHNLAKGEKLVLGGINIPSAKGTLAHSDGDAVIHALIDALLSAMGERDIGTFFPDTDPQYKDIDSSLLLAQTVLLLGQKNYRLLSVSITVILDAPKLYDYIPAMRTKLAGILGIDENFVAVAAKTSEQTAPDAVSAYAVAALN